MSPTPFPAPPVSCQHGLGTQLWPGSVHLASGRSAQKDPRLQATLSGPWGPAHGPCARIPLSLAVPSNF